MQPRYLAIAALFLCAHAGARPGDVAQMLECANPTPMQGEWSALAQSLGSAATCHESRYPSGIELECRAASAFSAYGLTVQEFILRESSSGTRELRGVFKATTQSLRTAAERRHRGVFEADGASGWRMNLDAGRWLHLDQREDGASELTCAVSGSSADDARRAGADATHGAIAGRLSFPTSPLPPMRVCAIVADSTNGRNSGLCTHTSEGAWSFLIGNVPPGEYFVLAWPERDNPNHYIMAHAASLQQCAPNAPGCAGGMLQRVFVHAGEVLPGIDALQSLTDLPASLSPPSR
jgi:hypothetical protein